jgi:hypothetical protein
MRIVEFIAGFEQHQTLNPYLWEGDSLRPDIKSALIKIADDFKNFIEIPFTVEDVLITGGQVSYNYTKHSDLDLHLVVDFKKVSCDREAAELFDSKRHLYKQKYDIQIKGIPVELYVEDIDFPAVSSSYSIISDEWIKRPIQNAGDVDTAKIEKIADQWQELIDLGMASKDVETGRKVLRSLRNFRKNGLKRDGEFGVANLVYKTLRNTQSLEKLTNFIDTEHSRSLSVY